MPLKNLDLLESQDPRKFEVFNSEMSYHTSARVVKVAVDNAKTAEGKTVSPPLPKPKKSPYSLQKRKFLTAYPAQHKEAKKPSKSSKKSKSSDNVPWVKISKDFFQNLIEAFNLSKMEMEQSLYRSLMHNFFEALSLVESKTVNFAVNRDLVVSFLDGVLKLLSQRGITLKSEPTQMLVGMPNVFPLKPKIRKTSFYNSKNLEFRSCSTGPRPKKCIFHDKTYFFKCLATLKRIAFNSEKILGFSFEESFKAIIKTYERNKKSGFVYRREGFGWGL